MSVPKTVFVMRYALTTGIAEAESVVDDQSFNQDPDGPYWWVHNDKDLNGKTMLKVGECAPDRAVALAAFEVLRAKRLASLKKQESKLRAMKPKFITWKKRGQE